MKLQQIKIMKPLISMLAWSFLGSVVLSSAFAGMVSIPSGQPGIDSARFQNGDTLVMPEIYPAIRASSESSNIKIHCFTKVQGATNNAARQPDVDAIIMFVTRDKKGVTQPEMNRQVTIPAFPGIEVNFPSQGSSTVSIKNVKKNMVKGEFTLVCTTSTV